MAPQFAKHNIFRDGVLVVAVGEEIPADVAAELGDADAPDAQVKPAGKLEIQPAADAAAAVAGDPLPTSAGQVVITGAAVQAGDALDVDDVGSTSALRSGVSTQAQMIEDGGAQQALTTEGAKHAAAAIGGEPELTSSAQAEGQKPAAGVVDGATDPEAYSKADLADMAAELGLPTSGTKAELAAAIDEAKAKPAAPETAARPGPDADNAGDSAAEGK